MYSTSLIHFYQVAIKIIDMSRLDKENQRKVKREVEIMKQLDHPNIIKLYQVKITMYMHMYMCIQYIVHVHVHTVVHVYNCM